MHFKRGRGPNGSNGGAAPRVFPRAQEAGSPPHGHDHQSGEPAGAALQRLGLQAGQTRNLRQFHPDAQPGRGTLPRHHRIRRHRHPGDQPRPDRRARFALPGREGAGQKPADAAPGPLPGRRGPLSRPARVSGSRRPLSPDHPRRPAVGRGNPRGGRPHRVVAAAPALRGAAGAGHQVCRRDRRDRPGQAGRRHEHVGRGGPALRADSAHAPGDLRRQRAARAGRGGPGRPVQHPGGAGRANPWLPDPVRHRRADPVLGQPGHL